MKTKMSREDKELIGSGVMLADEYLEDAKDLEVDEQVEV